MNAARIHQAPPPALLPTSGAAGAIALRIADRRKKLVEHEETTSHRPQGIKVASAGLAVMLEAANGSTPAIRCDRQVRYRLEQFAGGEPMPLEDITEIGEESVFGRSVAVSGLAAILDSWGFDVIPREGVDAPGALLVSAGIVARAAGDLVDTVAVAEADNVVTADEAADIQKKARHLAQRAQVLARVGAHRAQRKGGSR